MFCTTNTPEQRRFVRACWMSAALVTPLVLGAVAAFRFYHLHGFAAYVVAVLPTIPILWVLVELGRFLAVERTSSNATFSFSACWAAPEELWPRPQSGGIWKTLPTRRTSIWFGSIRSSGCSLWRRTRW